MFKAGVAGWDYKNWSGTVYPERAGRAFDKLEYLSLYLPLFEINRTYYRAATAAEARAWLERVAPRPGVVFTAKIPEQFVAPGKSWTREVDSGRRCSSSPTASSASGVTPPSTRTRCAGSFGRPPPSRAFRCSS